MYDIFKKNYVNYAHLRYFETNKSNENLSYNKEQ